MVTMEENPAIPKQWVGIDELLNALKRHVYITLSIDRYSEIEIVTSM